MKKKIFLTDSFSLNSGDQGILIATIDAIKKKYNDYEITVEASHPSYVQNIDELQGIRVYPRIFNVERIVLGSSKILKFRATVLGFIDSISFLLWATSYKLGVEYMGLVRSSRKPQAKALKKTDLLISSGGGFLSSHYKYGFRLYIYVLAMLLNKPVYIFAQSVGPFKSIASRILVPLIIRRTDLITVREPDSYRYLANIGITKNVIQTADIAVSLKKSYKQYSIQHQNDARVAICIREISSKKIRVEYVKSIESVSLYLRKLNYQVLIVSQTPRDDVMCAVLAAKTEAHPVLFGVHPKNLKSMYASCEFIITSRMHAAIFASETHIPFVAISYEPKFKGLVEQLGLSPKLLINESEIKKDDLIIKVKYLLRHRIKLTESLKKSLVSARKASLYNVTLIEELKLK